MQGQGGRASSKVKRWLSALVSLGAVVVQGMWRMKVVREEYKVLRVNSLAANEIQRMYRGHLGRKRSKRRREWESAEPGPDRLSMGLKLIGTCSEAGRRGSGDGIVTDTWVRGQLSRPEVLWLMGGVWYLCAHRGEQGGIRAAEGGDRRTAQGPGTQLDIHTMGRWSPLLSMRVAHPRGLCRSVLVHCRRRPRLASATCTTSCGSRRKSCVSSNESSRYVLHGPCLFICSRSCLAHSDFDTLAGPLTSGLCLWANRRLIRSSATCRSSHTNASCSIRSVIGTLLLFTRNRSTDTYTRLSMNAQAAPLCLREK